MFQIDMLGLDLFERSNGDESLVIVVRLNFRETIQYDCMQRALERAAMRYKLFHSVLASTGEGLIFQESSQKPVLKRDNRKYRLGSEELAHFPYRVSCQEKELTISLHHGITDGYGAVEFTKTLLYYYLLEAGKPVTDEGIIRLNEIPYDTQAEDELAYVKYYDPDVMAPQKETGSVVPFALPVKYWDEEGQYIYRHFKITLSAEEILKSARSSSATAVVNALICKSFAKAYDLEEKLLISSITSDFRKLLPSRTLQNFSGYIISFYSPNTHPLSLEETASAMKGIIQMNNTKENAILQIRETTEVGQRIIKMPTQKLFEEKSAVRHAKKAVRQSLGYLLTNIGRPDIPLSMAQWIEDMELYVPAVTSPIVIGMNTVNDKMTLSISQSFEDDALIHTFQSVCSDYGFSVEVKDMGLEEFDTLGIDGVSFLTEERN